MLVSNAFMQLIFDIFIFSSVLIVAYTCNFYYLAYLSSHKKDKTVIFNGDTPSVTIQLPVYNEKYVVVRLIESVCNMDYPKNMMKIMVLDDSDDDTVIEVEKVVKKYFDQGFNIEHIRRKNRNGYKAGALKFAMKTTNTDFVAIFDADFIPPNWFLKRAIQYFTNDNIGLVQCRWGHVNENYSEITRVQALSLDFHFLIEQKAKSNSHLFMNFNGTAGIWRRECIEDAGGWHTATLVEDLDLSYRAQMKGWKCMFLPDIVVDAELPVQVNAVKRQQFRWAKGSIQCATKLLTSIIFQRKIAIGTKIQAFVQLTRHIVFPLMLIQFLTLPILLAAKINLYVISFLPVLTIVMYLLMGPGAYLLIMRKMYDTSWSSKIKTLPFLLVYSTGLAVNNTVAVFDAVFGRKNEFLRTPKYGIIKKEDNWRDKAYNLPFTKTTLLELFFGVYGILAIFIAIMSSNAIFVPIIAIQTTGFLVIAILSIFHSRFKNKSGIPKSREERKSLITQKIITGVILGIIIFGGFSAFVGYETNIYPLDRTVGNLDAVIGSSNPQIIKEALLRADENIRISLNLLPEDNKNPVWLFPTQSTDLIRLSADVKGMISDIEGISLISKNNAAYHTAMRDIDERADLLKDNIVLIIPYMYVSISNVVFASLWIILLLVIFSVLNKKKKQLEEAANMDDGI